MASEQSIVIVVDTNVLVRYIIKDDRQQTEIATHFLRCNKCVLLPTVVLETVWVLNSKRGYDLARKTVVEKIQHIAGLPNMIVPTEKSLAMALTCV